jgi:hypothetical protein
MSRDACYIKIAQDGHRDLYGPFEEYEAIRIGYFARSVDDRDAAAKDRNTNMAFWARNQFEKYSPDEVRYLAQYPDEFGFKSCTIHSEPAPMHETWALISEAGREWMFNEDTRRRG